MRNFLKGLFVWLLLAAPAWAQTVGPSAGNSFVNASGTPTTGSLSYWTGALAQGTGNLSGDCTTSNTLAVTCTKTNGTAFAPIATSGLTGGGAAVSSILAGTNITVSNTGGALTINSSGGGGGSITYGGTAISSITCGTNMTCGLTSGVLNFASTGGGAGVSSFNTRTGAVTLSSSDVTTALGYTPAGLASPAFTGTPTAPTQTTGDTSTAVATDAFVATAVANGGGGSGGSVFPYVPNNNASLYLFGQISAGSVTTVTPVTSEQYFLPFSVPQSVTFSKMAIVISTAQAGDFCNVGIYNSQTVSGAVVPNTLLVSTGNISTAATGEFSASASITLSPNVTYWVSEICNSSTAGTKALNSTQESPVLGNSPTGSFGAYLYAYQTGGSGTTLTTPFTGSLSYGAGSSMPAIFGLQ